MVDIVRSFPAFSTLLITLFTWLHAEKHISGDLNNSTFTTTDTIYIIDKDISVPPEAHVTIPAGTILLFDAKTTFQINGICTIAGTVQNPVILTSVNDSLSPVKNAAPTIFDWNGIVINQSSTNVVFENIIIKYAEHPLISGNVNVNLRNCMRIKTADDFFIFNGTVSTVTAATPFSYPQQLPSELHTDSITSDTNNVQASSPPPPVNSDTTNAWFDSINWRIASASGMGVLGIGAGVAGILRGLKASAHYDSSGMPFTDSYRNDRYYSRYKKYYLQSAAAYTVSGFCFGVAAYFYFFHFNNAADEQTLIIPYATPTGEYGLTMKLRW